jgi:hypothetical protein
MCSITVIEHAKDYEMADKFSTDFKSSRWGLEEAKPNVSTLTGAKVQRAQLSSGLMAVSTEEDIGNEESGVTK